MGREIKRVPVDFGWPIGKKWDGFVNPFNPRKCPACKNGYSETAEFLSDQWYGNAPFDPSETGSKPFGFSHPAINALAVRNVQAAPEFYGSGWVAILREARRLAEDCFDSHWCHHLAQVDVDELVKADRLRDFTHDWTRENGWTPKIPSVHPTAEQVNAWSIGGMGHDSINRSICVRAKCERLGKSNTCDVCNGNATDPTDADTYAKMEAWKSTEPPIGEAYQIWETVSEGSPITPAFADPERLAEWCVSHQFDGKHHLIDGERWNSLAGGTGELSKEHWLKFIVGPGWAPSMVAESGKGVMSGVEAMVLNSRPKGESL